MPPPAPTQVQVQVKTAGKVSATVAPVAVAGPAFEAVMVKEPHRFLAIYGAAQASEALKPTAAAQKYYRQLTTMCKDAPAGRKELDEARRKSQ